MSDAVKTSSRIMPLVVGAIVVIAVVITIVVLGGRDSSKPSGGESSSTKPGHVKLEFRAMPPSTITLDGVKIGKTPITVTVPKKSGSVNAVARATVTRYYPTAGKKVMDVEQTQVITPDHDQTIDFQHMKPVAEVGTGDSSVEPATPGSAAP